MENNEPRSVSERTMSAYPLSVGTSLAIETLFKGPNPTIDPERPVPEFRGIRQYNEIWINVGTIFRNMSNAMPKMVFLSAGVQELHDALVQEMDVLEGIFQSNTNGLCKVIFYHATYKRIRAKHKHDEKVKFREHTSPYQVHYEVQFGMIMASLLKNRKDILEVDSEIRPKERTNALIMTHVPYDLIHREHFGRLELLESHTGKVKPHFEWNSKFYPLPGRDMSMLPFFEGMLYIFGDHVLIQPQLLKLRIAVYEVAQKGHWSPLTTRAKCQFDCERLILEPFVAQYVKSVL